MRTALAMPDPAAEALRRALLQRIADRLAFARALHEGTVDPFWYCCWVRYEYPTSSGRTGRMIQCLCTDADASFGEYLNTRCDHWHHEAEVFHAGPVRPA